MSDEVLAVARGDAFAAFRGPGFVKLPMLLKLVVFAVVAPVLTLAWAARAISRALGIGPRIRVSLRSISIGRRTLGAPVRFEVRATYGGGGRLRVELEDGSRVELPTEPLWFDEADALATRLNTRITPVEDEDGRYR